MFCDLGGLLQCAYSSSPSVNQCASNAPPDNYINKDGAATAASDDRPLRCYCGAPKCSQQLLM